MNFSWCLAVDGSSCVATGTATGALLTACDVEGVLARATANITTMPPANFLGVVGGLSLTVACTYSMGVASGARAIYGVKHPFSTLNSGSEKDQAAFLNAGRGYYNMLEHMPYTLLNVALCATAGEAPCTAGALAALVGVGRVLYTRGYAYNGPDGRGTGFILATFMSSAALGVSVWKLLTSFQ